MYMGSSSFENQEVRRKAAGLVHISYLCHLVKAEEQNLELDGISISCLSHLNLPRTLFCIHKERTFLFSVVRMSNPLISYFLGVILKYSIKRHHMNIIKSLIVWFIILQIWVRCCKNACRDQAGRRAWKLENEIPFWTGQLPIVAMCECGPSWPDILIFFSKRWAMEIAPLLCWQIKGNFLLSRTNRTFPSQRELADYEFLTSDLHYYSKLWSFNNWKKIMPIQ